MVVERSTRSGRVFLPYDAISLYSLQGLVIPNAVVERSTRSGRIFSPYDTLPLYSLDGLVIPKAAGLQLSGTPGLCFKSASTKERKPRIEIEAPICNGELHSAAATRLWNTTPLYCPVDFDFLHLLKEGVRAESIEFEEGAREDLGAVDVAGGESRGKGSTLDISRYGSSPNLPSARPCEEPPAMIPPPTTTSPPGAPPATSPSTQSTSPPTATSPPGAPLVTSPSTQSRNHIKRNKKRASARVNAGHVPKQRTLERYLMPAQAIPTALETELLSTTKGGYSATHLKRTKGDEEKWDLDSLVRTGASIIQWNGRETKPLVDSHGRVIAVLLGRPQDESYLEATNEAYDLLQREAGSANFTKKDSSHKRGSFPAVKVGIIHQQGTPRPIPMSLRGHSDMVARILGHSSIQRLARFASAGFQMYAPNIYNYYSHRLNPLYSSDPALKPIILGSIFPAAAFNFGPDVWTYRHRDSLNCPFGWCSIHALGDFNPKTGGHLILWDLNFVVEFPPGSCILIPSATLTHSNVPIQPGERRSSFTQFAAGGLFRYVDYGFRTQAEFCAQDPAGFQAFMAERESRWHACVGLFSQWEDLKSMYSSSV